MSACLADIKSSIETLFGAAYQQAPKSYNEGGLPFGAVMVKHGAIIAAGDTLTPIVIDQVIKGRQSVVEFDYGSSIVRRAAETGVSTSRYIVSQARP
jgi:hypothetical protein